MDKIFQIKLTEYGRCHNDAHSTTTIYVVADNCTSAINAVLTEKTVHVVVVDSHPCLIVK